MSLMRLEWSISSSGKDRPGPDRGYEDFVAPNDGHRIAVGTLTHQAERSVGRTPTYSGCGDRVPRSNFTTQSL